MTPNMKSEVEVNMELGTSSAKLNTDGRTDKRTKTSLANASKLTLVGTRDGDDFAAIGDVLEAGLWPTGERHDVVRRGERDEIPLHVRVAVLYRDGFRCQFCPQDAPTPEHLELDHIKPWSAGGSDATENLRTLCQHHNQERSNFIVPNERPTVPATWWCDRCYILDEHNWDYETLKGIPGCPIHGFWNGQPKSSCRAQRPYINAFLKGDPLPTWHWRTPIEYASKLAYCAHCDVRAMTDVTL